MNNSQVIPVRKQIVFATAIIFAIAVIISSAAVVAQQQINTNTSSQSTNSSSSSNPLSLNTIFKQTENSVVQITSKAPTTGVSNPLNQSSSNATTLGSGFVYDKQGHIVTNGHDVCHNIRILSDIVSFTDKTRVPLQRKLSVICRLYSRLHSL
jgi:S1-C subfamily serine protease